MKTKALIVVDIQNDFMPGGPLGVPEGDAIIESVNELMKDFDFIVATQDWHPATHGSFAENNEGANVGELGELGGLPQVMWPVHCVENTQGAEFVQALNTDRITKVFQKGTDVEIDSYSGFFDNGKKKATGLGEYLKGEGVQEVHVVGVATDYCVKFTALDANDLGFKTVLHKDCVRGVNLNEGDVEKALTEMASKGVTIL